MHLNGGDINRGYGVTNGVGIMRERTCIEDYSVVAAVSLMDAIDKVSLVIGLEKLGSYAEGCRSLRNGIVDVGKGRGSVNGGLSDSGHIKVWTV